MECPNCCSSMLLLFTSYVCDRCEPASGAKEPAQADQDWGWSFGPRCTWYFKELPSWRHLRPSDDWYKYKIIKAGKPEPYVGASNKGGTIYRGGKLGEL